MPNHIIVSDKMMRQRVAKCKLCGSRMLVGEYPDDPDKGDEQLAAWIIRHSNHKTDKTGAFHAE